jgi:FlaG/FlaF family flagellin (archaellin)
LHVRRQDSGTSRPRDERALSDLIGFVLTFAVILASVALVSTFGLSSLDDIQGNEQVTNAERAFTVLAEGFDEIERGRAPRRTSEIELNEGGLTVTGNSEFRVWVNGSAAAAPPPHGNDWNRTIRTDSLRYKRGDKTIVYENGATFRSTGPSGGSIVEDKPTITCTEDTAIISFIVLSTKSNRNLGSGTVRVTGTLNTSTVLYPTGRNKSTRDGTDVTVSVDSPRAQGWKTYFIGDQENWEEVNENTYVCSGVEETIVRRTVIDVQFTR